jgi:hypothetical protein
MIEGVKMNLRIERVRVHLVEMKLGFTYSSGTLTSQRALIWEIAAGGSTGLGECGFSGEKAVPGMAHPETRWRERDSFRRRHFKFLCPCRQPRDISAGPVPVEVDGEDRGLVELRQIKDERAAA